MLQNLLSKKWMLVIVCFMTSISMNAQYSAEVEQEVNTDWHPVPAVFSLSEIATTLGTDAATLVAALDEWMAAESPAENMFFKVDADGTTLLDGYTTGGEKGFWMSKDGTVVTFGNNSDLYANPVWDADAGEFYINIGLFPDALKEGLDNTFNFALKYNGNQATFAVHVVVPEVEQVDVPEPATIFESLLNIVAEKAAANTQYPRTGWDADNITVDMSGVAEALGISDETFAAAVLDMLYTPAYDQEFGGKLDSLSHNIHSAGNGFWYGTNEEYAGEALECSDTGFNGTLNKFYLEAFSYDAETATLSFNQGQYPGVLKEDEQYFVNFYFIWGDKAAKVRFDLTIEESPYNGLEDLTLVGEDEITVFQIDGGEEEVTFSIDTDNIAELLGVSVSDLNAQVLGNNGGLTAGTTANNGGYWMTREGIAINWPNGDFYIEPTGTAGDFTNCRLGIDGSKFVVGDTARTTFYFVVGESYYAVHVVVPIIARPEVDQSDWEIINRRVALVEVIPNDSYDPVDIYTLEASDIESLLGTADWGYYANTHDSIRANTGNRELYVSYPGSKYHCDPDPGVWVGDNGCATGWGGSAIVGICYELSSGKFQLFCMPGQCTIGETFQVPLYFVNEETHQMVCVNFTIQFVSEYSTVEEVGNESYTLPISAEDDARQVIDVEKVAEALGLTADELLEGTFMKGLLSSGFYSSGVDPLGNGLQFSQDGFCVEAGGLFYIALVEGEGENAGKYLINTYSNEDLEEGFTTDVTFCFEANDKRYVFNVKLVEAETFETGITQVTADKASDNRIFDLSGRQVQNPVRGIYIQNGKKFIKK